MNKKIKITVYAFLGALLEVFIFIFVCEIFGWDYNNVTFLNGWFGCMVYYEIEKHYTKLNKKNEETF